MLSFAVLFALIFIAAVPYLYHIKAQAQPTDFPALFAKLRKSLAVTATCMTPPVCIAALTPTSGTSGALAAMGLSALTCALSWVAAVIFFRHPITDDPLFRRMIGAMGLRPGT